MPSGSCACKASAFSHWSTPSLLLMLVFEEQINRLFYRVTLLEIKRIRVDKKYRLTQGMAIILTQCSAFCCFKSRAHLSCYFGSKI